MAIKITHLSDKQEGKLSFQSYKSKIEPEGVTFFCSDETFIHLNKFIIQDTKLNARHHNRHVCFNAYR